MKLSKIIKFLNIVEFEHDIDDLNCEIRVYINSDMFVLFPEGEKVMVEQYTNIFGDEGDIIELGFMTQKKAINLLVKSKIESKK